MSTIDHRRAGRAMRRARRQAQAFTSQFPQLAQLGTGISLCLEAGLTMPALVLFYATIDIIASVDRQPGEYQKDAFIRWVEAYLLPSNRRLLCTARDLYAARCGILHALSPESDLSIGGKVRRLAYVRRGLPIETLDEATRILQLDDLVVSIEDLLIAFTTGLAAFALEVVRDPVREQRIAEHMSVKWLTEVPAAAIEDLLRGSRAQADA